MLVLNEQDILRTISMEDMIDTIEHAYMLYENEQYEMPLRSHISDHENTYLLMPCVADHTIGIKIVSVFPNNYEFPVTQGIIILTDRKNGATKAILNGTLLTGLKTGAVSGAAIKYLSTKSAKTVGLIGTGYQGLYQLIATCTVRDIQDIYLYNRTSSKLPSFIDTLKNHLKPNVQIHITDNTLELVKQSEIIITSTSAHDPVLPNISNIYNGKLIVGIGSYQPHMREFPESLYMNLENLFIDTHDAKHETGDIIDPINNQWLNESQVISFSKVVTQRVKPVLTNSCPTVFKSTGMALFDLTCANAIYTKAIEQQIGTFIKL
ncbi:ornithine cyclodeaminase family protein [Heyndrickxia sp. NPDC080065]|uniref:ornithine cyclodeaminase family protein n=1 Tax=Heyndrickxia sp. NPDC080065 TaxID=3390568 RepID=UPI003D0323C8